MRVLFTLFVLIFKFSYLISQIATFTAINSTNFEATTVMSGITVSNLVAGSGITSISPTNGCNSNPRANVASWATSQNSTHSFSFTITANTGASATISSVALLQRRTPLGPTNYNIQIGATSNVGLVTETCNSSASGTAMVNLMSGQSITITIYYWRSDGSGGNLDFNNIVISGSVLPVEFLKFYAKTSGKTSIISFSTASETNNDYFTIERSGDGSDFDAIGEIDGAGNSSEERHYEFTDRIPLPGFNYYRIKQTDFDEKYSYSEIRSVRHYGAGKIVVSPRNTDGRLDIRTEMDSYEVAIYSSAGQEVSRFSAMSGHQSVDIESLQAGIYFVKVVSGATSETVKIVKY